MNSLYPEEAITYSDPEDHGRPDFAERIDRPLIWLYPLLYAVGGAVAARLFLL